MLLFWNHATSGRMENKTEQSSAASLLPNPCSPRLHYIREDHERKKARLKPGWKCQCVFVYLYDKEGEWGWDGCTQLTNCKQAGSASQPITTAERAGFHGDDAGMMLVPIDCWRGSTVGYGTGTHEWTHTHIHTLRRPYRSEIILLMTYGDVIAEYHRGKWT